MIKFLIFFSSVIFFLPSVFGSICPLDDDFVCNNQTKHECLCVPPTTTLNPIRLVNRVLNDQKYCNEIVDTEDSEFKVISITFNLTEEADKNVHDKGDSDENDEEEEEVNEEDIREKIARMLKIDEERVVLVQIECIDDDANLTVKFVVLKPEDELAKLRESDDDNSDEDDDQQGVKKSQKKGKDDDDEVNLPRSKYGKQQVEVDVHKTNKNGKKQDDDDDDDNKVGKDGDDDDEDEDEDGDGDDDDEFEPYEPAHLLDAKKVIRNLTKIRKGATLSDLKVLKIEDVEEVSSFEPAVSNTIVLSGVIAIIIGVVLVALLGCYISFKKCRKHSGYSDTLQRP